MPAEAGSGTTLSFHLQLRDPARSSDLLHELDHLPGATLPNGLTVADESEV